MNTVSVKNANSGVNIDVVPATEAYLLLRGKTSFGVPSQIIISASDGLSVAFSIIEAALLSDNAEIEDRDPIVDTTRLRFGLLVNQVVDHGTVAFTQSTADWQSGQYDPHVMLTHVESDSTDPVVVERINTEAKILAYLLSRFRFENDCITDKVKACNIDPIPA